MLPIVFICVSPPLSVGGEELKAEECIQSNGVEHAQDDHAPAAVCAGPVNGSAEC